MAYSSFRAPKWAKRSIDHLDVPECGCELEPVSDCRCETTKCKCRPQLFAAPCAHVILADHDVPFEKWAVMIATSPPPFGDSNLPSKPATDRTHARPGTEAKIDVMMDRVARGESCFNPGDLDMGHEDLDRLAYRLTSDGWRLVEERPEPPMKKTA